ncbi:hypothetical protein [Kitasatospora sp. NPDC001683]
MTTVEPGQDLALRCPCGSYGFHNMATVYHPASKRRDLGKGLVDAYMSGDCARCGDYVSTTIHGTHMHAHDPYDLN